MTATATIQVEEFEQEVLRSDRPVLVDFGAQGCVPCEAMSPVIDQLQEDFDSRAKVLKVDVLRAPLLAAQYRVERLPCLVFFLRGKEVGRLVGAASRGTLSTLLDLVGAPAWA